MQEEREEEASVQVWLKQDKHLHTALTLVVSTVLMKILIIAPLSPHVRFLSLDLTLHTLTVCAESFYPWTIVALVVMKV